MADNYLKGALLEGVDYSVSPFPWDELEDCRFLNCIFTEVDLGGTEFTNCRFEGCNFSNSKLAKTSFSGVKFTECKLQGLFFEDCSEFLFEVEFEKCSLVYCSFYRRVLKGQLFRNCQLTAADFTDAVLDGARFEFCDLSGSKFDNTSLLKADFSSAVQYVIDPERNRLKKARFSQAGLAGLLEKYDLVILP